MTNIQQQNFKESPWFSKSREEMISILGAGGIGSNTLYNLAKTLLSELAIFDDDQVETHNVGSQYFSLSDKGQSKVMALYKALSNDYTGAARINPFTLRINSEVPGSAFYSPIMIVGFDNMESRKYAFDAWKNHTDRELFIDGRLRATQYEVFSVQASDDKSMEKRYEETLFNDDEVVEEPCTFKQTAYAGMLIGARITSIVTNYLANKYTNEEQLYSVPFHYKELLEMCYTEINE